MYRGRPWLPPALLLALCLGLYAGALRCAFQFDDTTSIVDNPAIRSLTPAAWWRFWAGRTLTYGTFALDWRLHGLSVVGFHVVNVLIHGVATLCAYWLILGVCRQRKTIRSPTLVAWVAAAVFAAHPLQTQAVTYIVQRATSLSAACMLFCLGAYVHAHRRPRSSRTALLLIAAWTAGLLAGLAKELAITLPALVVLIDLVAFEGLENRKSRVAPFLLLFPIVPLVAWAGHSFGVAGGGLAAETTRISRWTYALTQIDVVARYLRLIALPLGQNVDHDVAWRHSLGEGSPPLPLLALVHAAWIALTVWAWRRNSRVWALPGTWFALTMLPESSLFPIRDAMFEHRLYLPMVGPALLVGLAIERLMRKHRAIATAASMALVLALGVATVLRNEVWESPESLWRNAVAGSPDKARPHMALGAELGRRGHYQEARAELERAIALRPGYDEAWTNLGNVRMAEHDLTGAIAAYRSALAADRSHLSAWRNLGAALDRVGDLDGAAQAYGEALRLRPLDPGSCNGLAAVRLKQGRLQEAWALAQSAARRGGGAPRLLEQIQARLRQIPSVPQPEENTP